MNSRREALAAAARVRHVRVWRGRGEDFLEAAGRLDRAGSGVGSPLAHLLVVALECHVKAFLCLARGGAPDTSDLSHLLVLAGHCGLVLGAAQQQSIAQLQAVAAGSIEPAPARSVDAPADTATYPSLADIEMICRHIAQQADQQNTPG